MGFFFSPSFWIRSFLSLQATALCLLSTLSHAEQTFHTAAPILHIAHTRCLDFCLSSHWQSRLNGRSAAFLRSWRKFFCGHVRPELPLPAGATDAAAERGDMWKDRRDEVVTAGKGRERRGGAEWGGGRRLRVLRFQHHSIRQHAPQLKQRDPPRLSRIREISGKAHNAGWWNLS